LVSGCTISIKEVESTTHFSFGRDANVLIGRVWRRCWGHASVRASVGKRKTEADIERTLGRASLSLLLLEVETGQTVVDTMPWCLEHIIIPIYAVLLWLFFGPLFLVLLHRSAEQRYARLLRRRASFIIAVIRRSFWRLLVLGWRLLSLVTGPRAIECLASVFVVREALRHHAVVKVSVVKILLGNVLVIRIEIVVGSYRVLNIFHEVVFILVVMIVLIGVAWCSLFGMDAMWEVESKLGVRSGWQTIISRSAHLCEISGSEVWLLLSSTRRSKCSEQLK
jgi:hypothetical protein